MDRQNVSAAPEMDDSHWNTLQEVLNALGDLHLQQRVEDYMKGRGIERPDIEILALRRVAFAGVPVT